MRQGGVTEGASTHADVNLVLLMRKHCGLFLQFSEGSVRRFFFFLVSFGTMV